MSSCSADALPWIGWFQQDSRKEIPPADICRASSGRRGQGGVQVVIQLFAIFAVIALRIGEAKEPFLEDRITPVPQGEGGAEPLMVIAESGDVTLRQWLHRLQRNLRAASRSVDWHRALGTPLFPA